MALSRFILPFADVGAGIKPSAGAKLFFFATGTGVPADTFNCPDGTTANSNPVIADSTGVFPDIFLSGTFKVILKTKNDVQIWEADPVTSTVDLNQLNISYILHDTLAGAKSRADIVEGSQVEISDLGKGTYEYVTGETANNANIYDHDTLALQLKLIIGDVIIATQFGIRGGVIASELAAQNDAIDIAIAFRKDIDFEDLVIWLDRPLVIDLGTQTGAFWEGTGYGQKFICHRTTFAARSDFVGDELVELAAPDCGIQGWVNFQCQGIVKHGCKMTGANSQIPEGGRAYGWTQSGIFISGRFGQQVGPFQGGDFQVGAKALIEANDNTGIQIVSPQLFRAPAGVFLCHFTSTFSFVVIGGSPDKCDEGLFVSQSQGKFLGVNLEGTKRPMDFDRSWVEISGRAQTLGGLALSPENSTDGVNLDIGDATTRKAGTSLVNGGSARVRLIQLVGVNWDFENDIKFTDFSGANSNELYIGQMQTKEGTLENIIMPNTMVLTGDERTQTSLTNTTEITVKGNGSGANKIEPDTTLLKSGFDISFDGLWFVVAATGVYEIELRFDLTKGGVNPANTVDFSILDKNTASIVYTTGSIDVPVNTTPTIVRFESNLGVGNGYRIQGVTDALSNEADLKNVILNIKRIGNIN